MWDVEGDLRLDEGTPCLTFFCSTSGQTVCFKFGAWRHVEAALWYNWTPVTRVEKMRLIWWQSITWGQMHTSCLYVSFFMVVRLSGRVLTFPKLLGSSKVPSWLLLHGWSRSESLLLPGVWQHGAKDMEVIKIPKEHVDSCLFFRPRGSLERCQDAVLSFPQRSRGREWREKRDGRGGKSTDWDMEMYGFKEGRRIGRHCYTHNNRLLKGLLQRMNMSSCRPEQLWAFALLQVMPFFIVGWML